jgi:hypothetical protein
MSDVLLATFAHHLRAHVLERILEVDFLGDGHAVLGDGGEPNFLSRTTLRPLGRASPSRVGELVDAAQDRLTRLLAVNNLFCHVL